MSTYGCARWSSETRIWRYFHTPSTNASRKIRPAASKVMLTSIGSALLSVGLAYSRASRHDSKTWTTVGLMRFAFKTSPQNTTWAQMLAVWQAADDIDVFESGWTFDHFYPIFSDSTGPCLEGWTTLTALAQATKRLRLGTLVTGIHYRHPAVLANMAAALDVISNGRLELGIGAGWNEEESGAYGIELGSNREGLDRFGGPGEGLTSLLSNETPNFDGKFYQLKAARNDPKGPQPPPPPICIGGS